jgi:tetratricopeptide (TPR) repeat protein
VALSVDEVPLGKLFSPAAHQVIRKIKFPYAAGGTDQRLLDQLEAVQRTLFGMEQPLVVPTAVLIDEHGRVGAWYRGRIDTARIAADAKALSGDAVANRARAISLAGKWRGEPRIINPQSLAETFYAGNFDDATMDYLNMLIAQGHSRAAGYEQLLPDRLYYLLGTLLEVRGRDDEAAEAFRVVLEVDEKHHGARRRLASIAGRLGRYEEAADTLRALVRANPDDVALRHEWAVRLADAGDIQQSIAQHREVLARQPDAIATANNLAWLLATNPDPEIRQSEEALILARRGCEETSYQRPEMLDTLAAAYASAGRIDGAYSTALRALELARKQKQPRSSIEVIEYHLSFYKQGEPFFEDPKRETAEE